MDYYLVTKVINVRSEVVITPHLDIMVIIPNWKLAKLVLLQIQ